MPEYYGVLRGTTRPRLGCRILVNRNQSKILPGLLNDLNTWVDETRIKSVKLLATLLLYSEEHTVQVGISAPSQSYNHVINIAEIRRISTFINKQPLQHLEKVLYSLYRTSLEPGLTQDVAICAQTLAQFVGPALWKQFVLSALAGASSG